MGKCANCQNSGWFLKNRGCYICGKEGCEECFIFLFQLTAKKAPTYSAYACSEACINKLATEIQSQISADEIDASHKIPPIHFFVERVILNSKRLNPKVTKRIAKGEKLHVYFKKHFPDWSTTLNLHTQISEKCDLIIEDSENILWRKLHRYALIVRAKHYETLREFENAAKIYKGLKMYKKAGSVRAKGQEITVKKTDVSVNLNTLIQQIRNGGIVAVYRCPHCGGKLKVDKNTTAKSLRKCEHCGTEIETVEIVEFLRAVLS